MKSICKLILAFGFLFTSCSSIDSSQRPLRFQAGEVSPTPPLFLPGKSSPFKKPFAPPQASAAPAPPGVGMAPPDRFRQPEYFSESITSAQQFDAMATLSEGFVKGAVVKFFIDHREDPARIYFIDGQFQDDNGKRPDYVQYHYYFAQKHLNIHLDSETFNRSTYFTNDLKQKKFFAGTLQRYEVLQSQKKLQFYGFQFYPQDHINQETLLYAARVIQKSFQIPAQNLKFVAYGEQQTFDRVAGELTKLKIEPTKVEKIYAGINYIPMHPGKAYGYLRFNPTEDQAKNLTPRDIPIFKELPLDLSVVAGVITSVIQDAGSHVNLKSKERNTPNMVIKDPADLKRLETLNGKPVQLTVTPEAYQVLPIEEDVLTEYYDQLATQAKWVALENGKAREVQLFDVAAAKQTPIQLLEDSLSYGGKSSRLAFLASDQVSGMNSSLQRNFGYRLTPMGFGLPVYYYQMFMDSNPELKKMIEQLADFEMAIVKPTSAERSAKLEAVQKKFLETKMPAEMVEILKSKSLELKNFASAAYPKSPLKKVKIRSSANAEDIPQFDGAGLHSSFSAKIDLVGDASEACRIVTTQDGVSTKEEMEPESWICGLKGVYASLWNKRAIEERNFAHIDQHSVRMGVAVNSNYDFRKKTENIKEIANAVLVTRVINTKGIYGYRISANTDENLVTNPTPNTQPEVTVASFMGTKEKPSFSVLQYAKIKKELEVLNRSLLKPAVYEAMVHIARQVESKYCQIVPEYYQGDCDWVVSDPEKPKSLDMEFKIYDNGQVLLKQTREFSGM